MSSTAIPVVAEPTSTFDKEVESRRRDGDADYDGWYCIKTDPFPCPANGCAYVAHYQTGAHLIVVWPRIDDPALLATARDGRDVGRNPRIVEYEPDFGRCIAWDEWVRLGRPIHGRLDRPEGWKDRPSRL